VSFRFVSFRFASFRFVSNTKQSKTNGGCFLCQTAVVGDETKEKQNNESVQPIQNHANSKPRPTTSQSRHQATVEAGTRPSVTARTKHNSPPSPSLSFTAKLKAAWSEGSAEAVLSLAAV
jgi:hypothetical protein